MNVAGKDIVILMFQYSVVVKGIEKKMKDMGCNVTTVADDLEAEIKRLAGHVELFLFYLPGEIHEDEEKKGRLRRINEIMGEQDQKMILVGERKSRDDLLDSIPQLKDYTWLDRPVDTELLENTVVEVINKKKEELKKHRILIVDDDPSYASMVEKWIADSYHVDVVTDGMHAITLLAKAGDNKVDLILLDYEMPVVDGPQILEMLRSEKETAHIPVVFLTGVGSKEAVSRVLSLKPDGYLLKTTTRAEILDYLKKKLP